MKKGALYKDIFREIWRTKARFLSIFAIITLGVGFFSGIKATGPNMIDTADHYFKDKSLMDSKVLSTYGLDKEDISILKKLKGTEILPSYTQDVFLGNSGIVAKVMSLPEQNSLNQYRVIEGRLPEKSGEIALDNVAKLKNNFKIGDEITFTSEGTTTDLKGSFKELTYKVTGFVNSPMYIETLTRGTSSIGKGTADGFAVIPESDFSLDYYTEAYLTFQNTKKLQAYSTEYEDTIEKNNKIVEKALADQPEKRLAEIKTKGEEKIAEGEKKIADAKAAISDGEQQLATAEQKLADGEAAYTAGVNQLQTELAKAQASIDENQTKIDTGKSEIARNEATLSDGEAQLNAAKEEFQTKKVAAETGINQGRDFVAAVNQAMGVPIQQVPTTTQQSLIQAGNTIDPAMGQVLTGYFAGVVPLEQVQGAINGLNQKLAASSAELVAAESQLQQKEQELANGRSTLEAAKSDLVAGEEALASGKAQLETERVNGEAQLASSRSELDAGQASFKEATTEFATKKADGEKEIAKGEQEIADAKKQLADLKEPEYFVLDRTTNPGYEEFSDNATRISAIAQVFPVFFFLIAALVSLTTMTRMVEEQRLQIGTLKALGYTNGNIAMKFIIYALLASVSATIVGLFIGYQLFPTIIFNAYGALYNLPDIRITYYVSYALISLVVALLCTVISAIVVTWVELKSNAAELMRPKAPKSGKRILLERIPFIWNRFGFNQKVTARNLFRYKQRMLMTVLGVAGCTALILTGFGLKNSIADIAGLQYGKIMRYQAVVAFNPEASKADEESYAKLIQGTPEITGTLNVRQENFKVAKKGVNTQEAAIFVPETTKDFDKFVGLQNRKTGEKYTIPANGVLVTEKLAKLFDLEPGKTFEITNTDNQKYKLVVKGITENYAGHSIYMNPTYYEEIFKTPVVFNSQLLTFNESSKWENSFGEKLTANPRVASTIFVNRVGDNFEDTMSSLNIVTLVLIISAALLAFVVLYNLTNINVSERIRELSTIKVLGFYDGEVSLYIYRENIILTLMGIVVGLGLGVVLHGFVLATAEVDIMMFSPTIKTLSYLYSAILTLLFSGIVMIAMHVKLKKIDMIEALKSVD